MEDQSSTGEKWQCPMCGEFGNVGFPQCPHCDWVNVDQVKKFTFFEAFLEDTLLYRIWEKIDLRIKWVLAIAVVINLYFVIKSWISYGF